MADLVSPAGAPKGKPRNVPQEKPGPVLPYSNALPANHQTALGKDKRTNVWNAFKEIETICMSARDAIDDAAARSASVSRIKACVKAIESAG